MAVVAVDFDNTLFEESAEGDVVPIEGAREALAELRQNGHHVVIHTCRTTVAREEGNLADEIAWIEEMLHANGMPFDEIYVGDKMIADAYVDDRAVAFRGDWVDALESLETHLASRRRGTGRTG